MTIGGENERLPCGTELASLVDQVAEGAPPEQPGHEASCPHCQSALAELERLWARVRELADEEVVAPARLAAWVIRRIRRELPSLGRALPLGAVVPRLVRHALLSSTRGATRIADSVIADIAGRAARATPGVRVLEERGVIGRIEPGVSVEVDEHRVTIALRLAARYGDDLVALASAVRRRVIETVEAVTGLEVVAVDVGVDDLL